MGPPCRELQQAVCRARTKLQSLERELHHRDVALEEEEELTGALQSQNAQLKSTLLDLYKGNAQVNRELRERLSPRPKPSARKAEREIASHRQFARELAALALPTIAASRMDSETTDMGKSFGDEEGSVGAASGGASDPLEKRPNSGSSSLEEEEDEENEDVEEEEEDRSIASPSSGTNESRLLSPAPSSVPPRPLPRTSLQAKRSPTTPDSIPRPPASTATTPSAASPSARDDPEAPSGGESRCNGFPSRHNGQAGSVTTVGPAAPGKLSLRNPRSLPSAGVPVGDAASAMSAVTAARSSIFSGSHAGPLAEPGGHHKHVPLLLAELEAAWELNKQLQERLGRAERELQTVAVDAELREEAEEARVAERAAALVQEVYAAQRERDAAVLARMRLAQQERDDALLRARQMEEERLRSEPQELTDSDVALEELLARIGSADSGPAIEQDGAIIVRRIARARERSRRITAEEMRAVLAERDGALARCAKLEEELGRLKEQNVSLANNKRNSACEGIPDRAIKAQLVATQQERDIALSRCDKLEEEIQTLRVYYSLHKSLSQETGSLGERRGGNNSHDGNHHGNHDGNHGNSDSGGSAGSRSPDGANGPAAAGSAHGEVERGGHGHPPDGRLQEAESERDALRARLLHAERDRAVADDKAERLERLVGVLRKKLAHQT
ncbi:mirror-image polydactyly gene 1 protein [Lampetra planeri]